MENGVHLLQSGTAFPYTDLQYNYTWLYNNISIVHTHTYVTRNIFTKSHTIIMAHDLTRNSDMNGFNTCKINTFSMNSTYYELNLLVTFKQCTKT